MMMRSLFCSAALLTGIGLPVTAAAQDWLGTHLDTQREANMREHQQRMLSDSAGGKDGESRYAPPISGKARHAAMRRHHREYAKIMKAHGYKVADQWLADQVAAGR